MQSASKNCTGSTADTLSPIVTCRTSPRDRVAAYRSRCRSTIRGLLHLIQTDYPPFQYRFGPSVFDFAGRVVPGAYGKDPPDTPHHTLAQYRT
eukprot:1216350-Rhodomonas_salina.3